MYSLISKGNRILRLIQICEQQQYNMSKHITTNKSPENLIISCKRKQYNFYNGTIYNKFDEIPLASKGWNSTKSKVDYFVVHPDTDYDQPIHSFHDIKVNPKIIQALNDMGITNATSLQMKAIPILRTANNARLSAETGCGKTLTYLIPLIESVLEDKSDKMNTPKALIIIPNRELAHQIGEVAKQIADVVDLKVKVIVGGRTKRLMMNPEFEDIDILIATPGAVGKLSTVGIYKLNEVKYTVLDEADTLLDDSFLDRMESLLKRVYQSRIILVAATCPKYLPAVLEPIQQSMEIITSERLHKPIRTITQRFLRITKSARPTQLLTIANKNKEPLLVFTNRNDTCNWLAMFLRENNVTCSNINGEMNQEIRINQWKQFISGETKVLSATDVGSRGLDLKQIRHVLNYDFPLYAADYIHRIGRTGRLSSPESCNVTNFVSGFEEIKLVQQIEVYCCE